MAWDDPVYFVSPETLKIMEREEVFEKYEDTRLAGCDWIVSDGSDSDDCGHPNLRPRSQEAHGEVTVKRKYKTGTCRAGQKEMHKKRESWSLQHPTPWFKTPEAELNFHIKENLREVQSEINEIFKQNIGKGIHVRFCVGDREVSIDKFNYFQPGASSIWPFFVIPRGTQYEVSVHPVLEFDEHGPHLYVALQDGRDVKVRVYFATATQQSYKDVTRFESLPLQPKAPGVDNFWTNLFYLLKLWAFRAHRAGILRRNLRQYWRARRKNVHITSGAPQPALPPANKTPEGDDASEK